MPQRQHVADTGVVQPSCVSQSNGTASVVDTFKRGQSTINGVLLLIAGYLSIIFNIVDLKIGTRYRASYSYSSFYTTYTTSFTSNSTYKTLAQESNAVLYHGVWCGIMVSFLVYFLYFCRDAAMVGGLA